MTANIRLISSGLSNSFLGFKVLTLEPQVTELVKDGKIDENGMIRARIGKEEYLSLMRLAGIRSIEDTELSNLEMNGQISFIRKEK